MRVLLAIAVVVWLAGCSAATWQAGLQGVAEGYNAAAPAPVNKLMLFGGPGHDVYLGCLTCDEYALDSVFNKYGAHGSPYHLNSIFNRFGEFGSPYALHSVCNPYSSDPPVIVDQAGRFYGRLTKNRYHAQATTTPHLLALLAIACGE